MYEGWYCPRCADFKTENEVGPDQTCPIHKIPLDREREENWFFKLSAFQEPLERLYAEQPGFVQPRVRYNEALLVHHRRPQRRQPQPLQAHLGRRGPVGPGPRLLRLVRRAPELLHGARRSRRDGEDLTDKFWPAFHIIGKDILKFHAVFWPAMLMAAEIELPREIFIHGYLLMKDASGEEHKMSKSLGNVLDPFEVMDRFGTDALRYYCFREVSFGQDGGVSRSRSASATRPSSPTSSATSPAARSTCSAATATARCPRWTSTRRCAPTSTASRARSRRCSTRRRSRRRSSASGSACGG